MYFFKGILFQKSTCSPICASRFMGHALPWRGTAQDGMARTAQNSKFGQFCTISIGVAFITPKGLGFFHVLHVPFRFSYPLGAPRNGWDFTEVLQGGSFGKVRGVYSNLHVFRSGGCQMLRCNLCNSKENKLKSVPQLPPFGWGVSQLAITAP